jgi:hypothetical protein
VLREPEVEVVLNAVRSELGDRIVGRGATGVRMLVVGVTGFMDEPLDQVGKA